MSRAEANEICLYQPHREGQHAPERSSRWPILGIVLSFAAATSIAPANGANVDSIRQSEPVTVAHEASPPTLDAMTLPTLESIDAQTDITAFMAPQVSDELRLPALRRAWSVNPAIRDFSGLAENDWDFNAPHTILGFGELDPSVDVDQRLAELFKGTPMDTEQPTTTLALVREPISPSTVGLRHSSEVAGWRQQFCLQSTDRWIVSALPFCRSR